MTRLHRLRLQNGLRLKCKADSKFLGRIGFSDESVFHVLGISNTQNVRIWGTEDPQAAQRYKMRCENITVWCKIHSQGVLDPYYFNS